MNVFDEWTEVFEELIDWPKRLANEGPFYRRWFDRAGVRRVLDVACGTGQHAAMFHGWGLQVEGADLSPQMIELARGRCGEPAGLRWAVRGFDAPVGAAEPFDAAVCVGNSLALAAERAVAERAIAQMLAALRAGGLCIVHVLNLWRLPDGPCVWLKSKRTALPQGDVFLARSVHRCGDRAFVELLLADLSGGAPLRSESAPLVGLEAPELEQMARRSGAGQVTFFGGYQDQPYDRHESVDLIMVAERMSP